MKSSILIAFIFSMMCFAEEAPLIARAIHITASENIPGDIPFGVRPMGYEPGFHIFYLVEGDGLIGLDESSVKVEYIKDKAGKNITLKRNGKPDYEFGSFPQASDDGKYLTFSIEGKSNQFGSTDEVKIKGQLIAHIADDRKEFKSELNMDSSDPLKMGPFFVINADNIPKDPKGVMGDAFAGMIFSDRETLNLGISGPMKSIIEVSVFDGDEKINKSGNSIDDKKRVYMYEKRSSKKFRVEISYWDKVSNVKVMFGSVNEGDKNIELSIEDSISGKTFAFSNETGFLTNLTLLPGGRILGSKHPNEATWGFDEKEKELVFYRFDGVISSSFVKFSRDSNGMSISGKSELGEHGHELKEVKNNF